VVKLLLDKGERVVASDLPKAFEHPKNKFIFARTGVDFGHSRCEVAPANLTDAESVAALFKRPITHAFHTASLYDYSAPIETLRRINVEGGRRMFDAALGCKTLRRFIHWSTCGVFGKPHTAREGTGGNIPFTEENSSPKNTPFGATQPEGAHLVNDYSITKWEQEQIAWQYHRERGLPLTVVRPAPIYGPGSDYGHGGIIISINQGLLPIMPADARNFINASVHVDDIAGFACFISRQPKTIGEDYNVGDDSIISFHEFLHYIALLVGRRIYDIPLFPMEALHPLFIAGAKTWLWLEQNFNVPRVRVFEVGSATYISSSYWISNAKSKAAGYQYAHPDIKEGLRETVNWMRHAGWLDPSYSPRGVWQENLKG
jgi:nucleoside-diphosphate-sugar epimerase